MSSKDWCLLEGADQRPYAAAPAGEGWAGACRKSYRRCQIRQWAYLGAENTGVDIAGRDYQIVIPAGTPLRLWLFSRHVALNDASGKAVDVTGVQIPFQATAGLVQTFPFTVSGAVGQSQ